MLHTRVLSVRNIKKMLWESSVEYDGFCKGMIGGLSSVKDMYIEKCM